MVVPISFEWGKKRWREEKNQQREEKRKLQEYGGDEWVWKEKNYLLRFFINQARQTADEDEEEEEGSADSWISRADDRLPSFRLLQPMFDLHWKMIVQSFL